MNYSPEVIIATTVRRYIQSPTDKIFWKQYLQHKTYSPKSLRQLVQQFISIEQMEQSIMQKGDEILFEYISNLDGNSIFPEDSTILNYEKEFFTPDDNDFYNRVIYEKEIINLKNEITILKEKVKEAIEAKKDFFKKDYKFIRKLGSGGFGTVSLVKHQLSNQLFAIKRLIKINKDEQSMIKKEIEILASLGHSNIIGFRTAFNVEESLYLVMEYCPKGTLQDKLNLKGKLQENEFVKLFMTLTKAFEFLHQRNIIHHDIKPSNILFDEDAIVKISDFGCVNSDIGTTVYLPPEAHENMNYTPNIQSDIFSLGVTLVECVLDYHPFVGKSVGEKIEILKMADLPISHLPLWLQDVIFKATHYDSSSRFASMKEFHDALIKRYIPRFLNTKQIKLEDDAKRLSYFVRNKKWGKAYKLIYRHPEIYENLNLVVNAGNFYLKTNKLENARYCFERALKLNPQVNIEKQIAEVYLQINEPSKASSILSEYINRNFYDLEAHNQLLYAYYLSNKWELGLEQAILLRDMFPKELIIKNNLFLYSSLLDHHSNTAVSPAKYGLFGKYNNDVIQNNNPISWENNGNPTLESKLLFQEYKFRQIETSKNEIELLINDELFKTKEHIISFGRYGYDYNTFSQFEKNNISRRHFIIINMRNNVWLYDLDSTGVFVDETRVRKKYFLLGFHKIRFGDYEIEIKTDTRILL